MTEQDRIQLFIHVEEPSMEAALKILIPKLLGGDAVDLRIIDHGSKQGLLQKLPQRLRGYSRLPAPRPRVLVLVDRDKDDCRDLKATLERAALNAGLHTKTAPCLADGTFSVVNRVVVEELEAWFFGDVLALTQAFPGVPITLATRGGYRDPDAITGGTWEALLRILKRAGHYAGSDRLPKIEVARKVAARMESDRNQSRSFKAFVEGLQSLLAASH